MGACESLGMQSLFADLGVKMDMKMLSDASASKCMLERRGLSNVKHIDLDHSWLQQEQARRLLPWEKNEGSPNPAESMTKNLPEAAIQRHIAMLNLEFMSVRAKAAAQLHSLKFKGKWG